jgi:predicted RNase H-like HicB family nuclease
MGDFGLPCLLPVIDETTGHSTKPASGQVAGYPAQAGIQLYFPATTLKERAMKSLFIRAEWDAEAQVWVATSDDVPGLVAEAETEEALLKKLHVLIPDLLDANGYPDGDEVPFELFSRRFDVVHRKAA